MSFFLSIIFLSSFARAGLSGVYASKVAIDASQTQALLGRVKTRDHSLCPGLSAKDEGSCVAQKIRSMDIRSTPQITTVMLLAVIASQVDKESGYSAEVADAMLIDNLTTLTEVISISKFHLAHMPAPSPADRAELAILRRDDETLLRSTRMKMIEIVTNKIAVLQAPTGGRLPAATQNWVASRIDNVKERIGRFKSGEWRYTP